MDSDGQSAYFFLLPDFVFPLLVPLLNLTLKLFGICGVSSFYFMYIRTLIL